MQVGPVKKSPTPIYGYRKQSKCIFDSDRHSEFHRIRDIRVRDIDSRLYLVTVSTSVCMFKIKMFKVHLWGHPGKGTLLGNKQCHPRSAVFTLLREYFWFTLHRERQKSFLQMFMSDKYHRSWSDATHCAWRPIRAYGICSAIRYLFADDVTFKMVEWGLGYSSTSENSWCLFISGYKRTSSQNQSYSD